MSNSKNSPSNHSHIQRKLYPINKICMGDVTDPNGNNNCTLAHKVKSYLMNLEAYKRESSKVSTSKNTAAKDGRWWHHSKCPQSQNKDNDQNKPVCSNYGGIKSVEKDSASGTRASPSIVTPAFKVTENNRIKIPLFRKDYVVENFATSYNLKHKESLIHDNPKPKTKCCCGKPVILNYLFNCPREYPSNKPIRTEFTPQDISVNNVTVNNAESTLNKYSAYNCLTVPDDKECKCSPPKPSPPCHTFDCDCITEAGNIRTRKIHRAYCPLFKHKSTCPVMMIKSDEENKEDEDDEAVPLPYGLPPINLAPCPVMGKPCTYPDGFQRMYKTAAQPALPLSSSDAGKVCCSKEYERIKKALHDFMKIERDHDFRCINKFNVDTERRCCDKEQRLMPLTGKDCCGTHKLLLQLKYKSDRQ